MSSRRLKIERQLRTKHNTTTRLSGYQYSGDYNLTISDHKNCRSQIVIVTRKYLHKTGDIVLDFTVGTTRILHDRGQCAALLYALHWYRYVCTAYDEKSLVTTREIFRQS